MIENYFKTAFRNSGPNEFITWLYSQGTKTAWLIHTAMSITIIISRTGLFGPCMYTAQKRTKETGDRRVPGTSVANVTAMLCKDFFWLIIIATIMASFLAHYISNQWLRNFAYRTNFNGWIFLIAGAGAILIALFTVSFRAIKLPQLTR